MSGSDPDQSEVTLTADLSLSDARDHAADPAQVVQHLSLIPGQLHDEETRYTTMTKSLYMASGKRVRACTDSSR